MGPSVIRLGHLSTANFFPGGGGDQKQGIGDQQNPGIGPSTRTTGRSQRIGALAWQRHRGGENVRTKERDVRSRLFRSTFHTPVAAPERRIGVGRFSGHVSRSRFTRATHPRAFARRTPSPSFRVHKRPSRNVRQARHDTQRAQIRALPRCPAPVQRASGALVRPSVRLQACVPCWPPARATAPAPRPA